jgi:hypothetical protein
MISAASRMLAVVVMPGGGIMASAQMPLTSVPSAMAWAMSASVMMPAG